MRARACVCVRVCVCGHSHIVSWANLQGGSPVTGQADCEYAASEAHLDLNDKR